MCALGSRQGTKQEDFKHIGRVKLFRINLLKSKWNKFIVDLCVCEWLVEFNGYKRTAKGKKWKIFGLARFSLACVLFFCCFLRAGMVCVGVHVLNVHSGGNQRAPS